MLLDVGWSSRSYPGEGWAVTSSQGSTYGPSWVFSKPLPSPSDRKRGVGMRLAVGVLIGFAFLCFMVRRYMDNAIFGHASLPGIDLR